jgi:hypothetical protein
MDIATGLARHMESAGILWLQITVLKLKTKLAAKQAGELAAMAAGKPQVEPKGGERA